MSSGRTCGAVSTAANVSSYRASSRSLPASIVCSNTAPDRLSLCSEGVGEAVSGHLRYIGPAAPGRTPPLCDAAACRTRGAGADVDVGHDDLPIVGARGSQDVSSGGDLTDAISSFQPPAWRRRQPASSGCPHRSSCAFGRPACAWPSEICHPWSGHDERQRRLTQPATPRTPKGSVDRSWHRRSYEQRQEAQSHRRARTHCVGQDQETRGYSDKFSFTAQNRLKFEPHFFNRLARG
jgi:hypothetical protein